MDVQDSEGLRRMMEPYVSGSHSPISTIVVTALVWIAMILAVRLAALYLNLDDLKDDEDLEPW